MLHIAGGLNPTKIDFVTHSIHIYINRSKKVLHIQFGGQYLPQYSIFNHMSCIIMEAWLFCFSFMLELLCEPLLPSRPLDGSRR